MTRRRWQAACGLAGVVLLASAGVALAAGHQTSTGVATPGAQTPAARAVTAADPLAADITRQQATLTATPGNAAAWAALGLDYVQQAKITVQPEYYPKAAGALARSLALQPGGNVAGIAGQAALQAALHNFTAARGWALRGLALDPYSATLYGALDDADTQLGLYPQAFQAAQKMNDLYPGVPAYTRAEYVFELRGDTAHARQAMQTALTQATSPADRAFAHYYLGELAFNSGDPTTALADYQAGLASDPTYSALLEGKAKAEAALGRNDAAAADYATVINEVPQPQYVIEAGELAQATGHTAQAQADYRLFGVENQLFTANGVTLDTDPTLFYADHGNPHLALAYGTTGIRIRPFIEMDDAYAWALHVNHRDRQALSYERKALQLGTRNALFTYHLGMIEHSLGMTAAARTDLTHALAINPHFNPLQAPVLRQTLTALDARR